VSTHKPAHISLRVTLFKGYGLIERFSEDIGQPATVEELEGLSAKKCTARLDAIRGELARSTFAPYVSGWKLSAAADARRGGSARRPRAGGA
jgi:hypothetical protein